jgi:hypothetical protein
MTADYDKPPAELTLILKLVDKRFHGEVFHLLLRAAKSGGTITPLMVGEQIRFFRMLSATREKPN